MIQRHIIILHNRYHIERFLDNPGYESCYGYYPNPQDNRYHEITHINKATRRRNTINDFWDDVNNRFIPQETNYTFQQLCNLNEPKPYENNPR
jgi:hypothetical protein